MISSLIEWPHRSTCHHPSRHNRGEATGTWIPRQIEDIPSIISIQSASNSLIALNFLQRGQAHRGSQFPDKQVQGLSREAIAAGFRVPIDLETLAEIVEPQKSHHRVELKIAWHG